VFLSEESYKCVRKMYSYTALTVALVVLMMSGQHLVTHYHWCTVHRHVAICHWSARPKDTQTLI